MFSQINANSLIFALWFSKMEKSEKRKESESNVRGSCSSRFFWSSWSSSWTRVLGTSLGLKVLGLLQCTWSHPLIQGLIVIQIPCQPSPQTRGGIILGIIIGAIIRLQIILFPIQLLLYHHFQVLHLSWFCEVKFLDINFLFLFWKLCILWLIGYHPWHIASIPFLSSLWLLALWRMANIVKIVLKSKPLYLTYNDWSIRSKLTKTSSNSPSNRCLTSPFINLLQYCGPGVISLIFLIASVLRIWQISLQSWCFFVENLPLLEFWVYCFYTLSVIMMWMYRGKKPQKKLFSLSLSMASKLFTQPHNVPGTCYIALFCSTSKSIAFFHAWWSSS